MVLISGEYHFKKYTGKLYSLAEWVFHCFNKYGYDIGLQIRDQNNGKLRSSQKVYYMKGDKYKQKLSELNPDSEIKIYFNDGSKEKITLDEFYKRANDGNTILPFEIISDQDFEHNEIDLKDPNNPLIPILKKLDETGLRYSVYGTEEGRAIKIKLSFSGLMELEKRNLRDVRDRIGKYISYLINGEVFKSGKQCNPCFPVIEGKERLHAKTNKPIKLLHHTGRDNNLNFILKLITDYEGSQEAEDYAHLEKTARRIFAYTDKLDLANKFWKIQPFFYDEAKLWWLWDFKLKMWKIIDEIDLMNAIDRALRMGSTVNKTEKAEIIEALKRVGRARIPAPIKKTMIQFVDQIYDLENGEIIEANPELFATNPIPHKIGKTSETPVMDKIFKEWVGEEYVPTLYQIIAYCMLPDYPLHRIFCLVGAGMNGKGKYLELISRFIGENNKTSTELDYLLKSRFETAKLYKKLVCLMGETNFTELSKTSLLKRLSGGDTIGFEFKNKNPFDEYNYAKIVIATNSLPVTTDKTRGFYRRWLLIDFPFEFNEKKDILADIPDIEYQNLAKKGINILKLLLKNREFMNEGDIDKRAKRYEERSNPIAQFIKDKCIISPDKEEPFFMFYDELSGFLSQRGYRTFSKREVGRILRNEGYELDKKHVKVPDKEMGQKHTKWLYIYGLCIRQKDNLSHYDSKGGPDGPDGPRSTTYSSYRKRIETTGPTGPTGPTSTKKKENKIREIPGGNIYHPCSICSNEPSYAWDMKGKPICKECAGTFMANNLDVQEETVEDE